MNRREPNSDEAPGGQRFSADLMYAAARLYYLEEANQADVAKRLGTSRATVSRLLSESRRRGIVRIDVIPPERQDDSDLASDTAAALGVDAVHLSTSPADAHLGASLAPPLSAALEAVDWVSGDVLLVSSGRSIYEAAQFDLPDLPGILVAPMVGGQDDPEAWYQTNEITRTIATKIGGRPVFLYAPALPSPELFASLGDEPSFRRISELWHNAKCAVVGVGAPPVTRTSLPAFVPTDTADVRTAIGDICSRFYDRHGAPVAFPGSDRLVATGFDVLQKTPVVIAVAAGDEKVEGIATGARAGFFNQLVTDPATASKLIRSS